MKCKICESDGYVFAESKILQSYKAEWWQCGACKFVCPVEIPWLNDAYKSTINFSDVGLVSRSTSSSDVTKSLLEQLEITSGPFCDYGGGYGLFVRMMRDKGYDFYWNDPYCENLFARMFESVDGQKFKMVTAFEVFEHLSDPKHDVLEILKFANVILFSTSLLPEPRPMPDEWWYYGLEHGQHVSLYSTQSLQVLADINGLDYKSVGGDYHLFYPSGDKRFVSIRDVSMRPLNYLQRITRVLQRKKSQPLQSLLQEDYRRAVSNYRE